MLRLSNCYIERYNGRINISPKQLVVLREWNSVTEAEMAKSILDGAGIFSTIRNEYMSAIYPIGTMPAQLVVKEEDAKRAAELLDKMP